MATNWLVASKWKFTAMNGNILQYTAINGHGGHYRLRKDALLSCQAPSKRTALYFFAQPRGHFIFGLLQIIRWARRVAKCKESLLDSIGPHNLRHFQLRFIISANS